MTLDQLIAELTKLRGTPMNTDGTRAHYRVIFDTEAERLPGGVYDIEDVVAADDDGRVVLL